MPAYSRCTSFLGFGTVVTKCLAEKHFRSKCVCVCAEGGGGGVRRTFLLCHTRHCSSLQINRAFISELRNSFKSQHLLNFFFAFQMV